jgi:hypothetical protein
MQTVHELYNVNLGTRYAQQKQEILPLLYVRQSLVIIFKRALISLLFHN